MSKAKFFFQEREDGAARAGFGVENSDRNLYWYRRGADEPDPTLTWYIDIDLEGRIPNFERGDAARRWLLSIGPSIQNSMELYATEFLSAGVDSDWPSKSPVYPIADDLRVSFKVSAMRRLAGTDIAQNLKRVSEQWPELVPNLKRQVQP